MAAKSDPATAQIAWVEDAYNRMGAKEHRSGKAWTEPAAKRLVELLRLQPGTNVADLGCGTGPASRAAALAVIPDGHVTAVDNSTSMLKLARQRARDERLRNIRFVPGDITKPELHDGVYHAVLASMVLYLLPDPLAALARWRRLLRADGQLGLAWVRAEDPRFAFASRTVDKLVPDDQETWTDLWLKSACSTSEMDDLLSRAGFVDIRTTIEPVTTYFETFARWWGSCWEQGPGACWEHIPEDRRADAEAAAYAAIKPAYEPDGRLRRTRMVGYTTARKFRLDAA